MKKIVSILLAILMVAGLTAIPALAESEVSVYLFGDKLEFDVPPQIINGRTMVPMRKIFESLGASVDWDAETKTVTSVRGNKTISLTINNYTMSVNGTEVELDVAPCIVSGRTMVPARAVSESFNLKVDWDSNTKSVLITEGVVEKEGNLIDEMKAIIMEYGEYEADENAYYAFGEYGVVYVYDVERDEILMMWFFGDEEETTEQVTVLGVRSGDASDGYFAFSFSDGTEMSLYGLFDKAGNRFDVKTSDFPSELEDTALKLMFEVMKQVIEPDLYESFGITLEELNIAY